MNSTAKCVLKRKRRSAKPTVMTSLLAMTQQPHIPRARAHRETETAREPLDSRQDVLQLDLLLTRLAQCDAPVACVSTVLWFRLWTNDATVSRVNDARRDEKRRSVADQSCMRMLPIYTHKHFAHHAPITGRKGEKK